MSPYKQSGYIKLFHYPVMLMIFSRVFRFFNVNFFSIKKDPWHVKLIFRNITSFVSYGYRDMHSGCIGHGTTIEPYLVTSLHWEPFKLDRLHGLCWLWGPLWLMPYSHIYVRLRKTPQEESKEVKTHDFGG